ncbi:hypothetical protein F2P79_015936 [Pimephales promelas]|nr:hypothetical protein F2P79_015936 [Pimephales promelas]
MQVSPASEIAAVSIKTRGASPHPNRLWILQHTLLPIQPPHRRQCSRKPSLNSATPLQNLRPASVNPVLRCMLCCDDTSMRKMGEGGGVCWRLRKRPFKPPLPSIILSNVRSLRNKMDILHAKCLAERTFKEAGIITLTETWLDEAVPDSEVDLENYEGVRQGERRRGLHVHKQQVVV